MRTVVEALAQAFSKKVVGMVEDVFPEEAAERMQQIIEHNRRLPDDHCASHDYVDSQQALTKALGDLGMEPDASLTMLCDEAWTLAKRNDFYFKTG